MAALIMTKGLPGSGKSRWARAQVAALPAGDAVRVSKDDLRNHLLDGRYARGVTELQMVAARDALIGMFLARGVTVYTDDTNLDPIHEVHLRALAQAHGAEFQVQDFTYVPVWLCIERDNQRRQRTGEATIRRMAQTYLLADAS